MQIDRMFSSETAITIEQKKEKKGVHLYDGSVILHCLTMAQRETADVQMKEGEKKMIDEHLKLLTMPRTILFYKKYKK